MKATFQRDELLSAINRALGCVSGDKTLQTIEGILISTDGSERCEICSYDLEKGMKTYIRAEVFEGGNMILNGQKFASIVKFMPADITLETIENNMAVISSGKSKFRLHYVSGDSFPAIPTLSPDRNFELPQCVLRKVINQTAFAISHDESRPVLTGLYFEVTANTIKAVSCDSFRLAIREVRVDTHIKTEMNEEEIHFIIPLKTVNELSRLLEDKEDPIRFSLTRKHVIFSFENKNSDKPTTLFSRLIDQLYLEYERFLPKESKTFVEVDRNSLEDALIRATLVTEDRIQGQTKSVVKLSFKGENLIVSADSINGSVSDEIPIKQEGPNLLIGFDCKRMLEIMSGTDDDTLKLSLTSSLMSMIIEGTSKDKDTSFIYLAIPMKMRESDVS